MKVFISWSGSKSQEVAKVLKHWIPCVIQSVEPYFSSADIDKGARWSTDIAKELQNASFGILCVTKDNLSSAWLNFEAGALSKSIEQAKVCPFLVDLKPTDIQDSPILQFQMANATKDDVFKLFKSINANLSDSKLDGNVLETTFETFWPKIEEALQKVTEISDTNTPSKKTAKEAQASIEEILELVRYQHKLLKTPDELLPPSYLYEVLRRTNGGISRDFILELMDHLHVIESLAADALSECTKEGPDSLEYSSRVKEILDRTKRMGNILRRRSRNLDYMF